MPGFLSPAESALARWLAHGVTSRTHPVLYHIFQLCFQPLGIEACWLEAEPFGSLDWSENGWWLRRPIWNPARFDRQSSAASDFGPLLDHPEYFAASVDSQGVLSLAPTDTASHFATAYLQSTNDGWDAIRHSVRAAHRADMLIYAAAGLLVANDPIAAVYAQGGDDAFCEALCSRAGFSNLCPLDDTREQGRAKTGIPAAEKPATVAAP